MKNLAKKIWILWGLLFLANFAILIQGACLPSQKLYAQKKAIANRFLLTDYCLSTESRHLRHISLPEPIAPFQDLPAYHEHFPSSSFLWHDLQLKSKKTDK